MTDQLPLMEQGILRGEVRCRSDGFRSTFSIDVPPWTAGVKKVWLVGPAGGRLLLGTLMPEQGRLRLTRTLSHSSLRTAGVEDPVSAEIDPGGAQNGWQSLRTFTSRDSIIQRSISTLPQGSWRREEGRVVVRFPWRVDMPVPVTALFCLSEVKDGAWYVFLENQ